MLCTDSAVENSSSSFGSSACCPCADELTACRAELAACRAELSRWRQDLQACQEALRRREEELWVYRDALMSSNSAEAAASTNTLLPKASTVDAPAARVVEPDDVDRSKQQSAVSEYTLLTDFLPDACCPLELTVEQVMEIADSHCLRAQVWRFGELEPSETLQQHVAKQINSGSCPAPSTPENLVYISKRTLADLKCPGNHTEGAKRISSWFRNLAALWTEWQTSLKNLLAGTYTPFLFRAVLFGEPGKYKSKPWNIINWPTILVDADGKRYWGMVRQNGPASLRFQLMWSLRDLLIVKHSPITINTVAADDGTLLWQNAASTAMFGCHGLFNARISMMGWDDSGLEPEAVAAARSDTSSSSHLQVDFLKLLMGRDQEKLEALRSTVQSGKIFCVRVQIVDPTLRSWMGLGDDEEAHHDVQVTLSSDPITLQRVYTVSQVDVTDVVLAQRELAEEKQRADTLLERQHELIAILGKVTEVAQSPANNESAAKLIDGVRRKIAALGMEDRDISAGVGKIEILELLGEGSYGKVYKGLWRGTVVAVKSMVLPFGMSGAEKHERMAIMEAALSASLSHPNVVQTFTYSIQPVRDSKSASSAHAAEDDTARMVSTNLAKVAVAAVGGSPEAALPPSHFTTSNQALKAVVGADRPSPAQRGVVGGDRMTSQRSVVYNGDRPTSSQLPRPTPGPGAGMRGFEMQLVLEFCDCGTLRDALDQGAFLIGREVNYPAVCETAADIAKGMLQLHSVNVVHSDLKARNVLLRSNASEARGVTAKIADFGLSFKMDNQETHVSSVYHGTLTHMAPEVLLQGCQSKASDIYAFGITLWELYTAGRPFMGVPQALIGHQITAENRRPVFACDAPPGYVELAQRCWDPNASLRPGFEEILSTLLALREGLHEPTSPLRVQVKQASYPGPSHSVPLTPLSMPFAPAQPVYSLPSNTRLIQRGRPSSDLEPLAEEPASLVADPAAVDDSSPAIVCTAAGSTTWDHRPLLMAEDKSGPAIIVGGTGDSKDWDKTGF